MLVIVAHMHVIVAICGGCVIASLDIDCITYHIQYPLFVRERARLS